MEHESEPLGKAQELLKYARETGFSISSTALLMAAERRGIPWIRVDEHSIQFGYGRWQKRICGTQTSETPLLAIDIAADKVKTNRILSSLALPVPRQCVVRTAEEAVGSAQTLGYPLVIKPIDGNHGLGVTTAIRKRQQIDPAFFKARQYSERIIAEEHIAGNDFRMLVVNNRFIAACRRIPAYVVGDGCHTIAELVEMANSDPRRSKGYGNILTALDLDSEAEQVLERSGRSFQTSPRVGEIVYLRLTANLSRGGMAVDVTDAVHPENRALAVRAVKAIGLDVGGVDFIASGIETPFWQTGGAICEVNSSPGLRMHLVPAEGPSRDVAAPIIEMLFPPGSKKTIPVISLSESEKQKPATEQILTSSLGRDGSLVGRATRDGVWINRCFLEADNLEASVKLALIMPVDAVIVEDSFASRRNMGRSG